VCPCEPGKASAVTGTKVDLTRFLNSGARICSRWCGWPAFRLRRRRAVAEDEVEFFEALGVVAGGDVDAAFGGVEDEVGLDGAAGELDGAEVGDGAFVVVEGVGAGRSSDGRHVRAWERMGWGIGF
jgi:hypothetical protein